MRMNSVIWSEVIRIVVGLGLKVAEIFASASCFLVIAPSSGVQV